MAVFYVKLSRAYEEVESSLNVPIKRRDKEFVLQPCASSYTTHNIYIMCALIKSYYLCKNIYFYTSMVL